MGDADGGSCSDALRQHKSKVTHLVGDVVRRQGFLADPADDDERGGEEESLRKRLQTDRCSEGYQVLHFAPRNHPSTDGSKISTPFDFACHRDKETNRHEKSRNKRCPSCSFCSHGLKPPMAEDKNPVQTDIEQVAPHGNHHCHEGVSEPLQELLGEAE